MEGCEVDLTILDSVVGCWLRRRSPCRPGARLPGSTIVGNNNYYINYNYYSTYYEGTAAGQTPRATADSIQRLGILILIRETKGHAGGYPRQSISTRVAREWPRIPACEQKTRMPRNKTKSSFSRGEALCSVLGGFRGAKACPNR